MKITNLVWAIIGVVLAAAVITTAAVGVTAQRVYADLDHGEPYSVEASPAVMKPIGQVEEINLESIRTQLTEAAELPGMGNLHGIVTDTTDGSTLWESAASQPATPASATKVLTAAAAIVTLELDDELTTEVVAGSEPGTVIIRGNGNVWLDKEDLDDLASQLKDVSEVLVDTSYWTGPQLADGWDEKDIDGGYVAPMQPAMINGGRGVGEVGDVPRSHTPAEDVAAELATRLDAELGESEGEVAPDAEVLAEVTSDPLLLRLQEMVKHSDNVAAEAIGRQIAIKRDHPASFEGTVAAIDEALTEVGLNTEKTTILDASGLSRDNLIRPTLLNDIMQAAVNGDQLRPLLGVLPVAFGEGTLKERYQDLSGRGWVRAKTGTLTGTNALVGTVTGQSGRVYTFALLANDSDFNAGRRALDVFASVLRDA